MEERNTETAFKWIVGLLQKHGIPFQISGGFAAQLYGANRELNDIDIGIPDSGLKVLYPEVREFVSYGPSHFIDEQWDLMLMSLKYKGQEIDLAGRDGIKFFDKEAGQWIPGHRDLVQNEMKEVFGLIVPVIPRNSLVAYKRKLMRDVDIQDIEAIE